MDRCVFVVIFIGIYIRGCSGDFSNPLSSPIAATSSEDATCRHESRLYLESLASLTPWALNMFDSSAKVGSGFLRGHTDWLGDYDQCLSVSGEHVSGKYCLAAVHVAATWPLLNRSVADMLDLAQAHNYIGRELDDSLLPVPHPGIFLWGVCVPGGCSERDVQEELAGRLPPSPLVTTTVQVRQGMCHTEQDRREPFSTGDLIALGLLAIPCVLSLISWLLEARLSEGRSKKVRVLASLSFGRNWRRLFDLTPDTDNLRCVHGIRVLFVILLYLLHKASFFTLYPVANKIDMIDVMDQKWTMIVRAFWNYVDAFFLISGLLTSFYAAKKLKNGQNLNIFKMYIRRYYKFTGLMVVLYVFYVHLFPHMISGPLAMRYLKDYFKLCDGKLWKVLGYLAIFDGVENMCLTSANHLMMDMHMYLLSPFLIIAMWKRPKSSAVASIAILAAITVYKYHVIIDNNLPTVIYNGLSYKTIVQVCDKLLFSSILRFPNYLIGVALGVLLQKIDCKMSLPKPVLVCCHVLCAMIALYCLAGPAHVIERGYVFKVEDSLRFGLLQPLLWPLVLAWTILVCATGNAKGLERVCSHPVFNVGSRILYAFNLLQMPINFVILSRVRVPIHFSLLSLIDLHELLIIFIVSIFLTVVFLMPLGELWNIMTNQVDGPSEKRD